MLGILEQILPESLFLQSSVSISDWFSFQSLLLKYKDAFDNEMAKMESVFNRLEITSKSQLSTLLHYAHLYYLAQHLIFSMKELYEKVSYSGHFIKGMEYCRKDLTFPHVKDRIGLFETWAGALLPLIQKHKNKILDHAKDLCFQLGNLAKVFFSSISTLRLRVHESLLARSYCNLWFSKNGKSSEYGKNRESFALFVREDIKSYPLDEEFIKLSLTFFDRMIKGRDPCQIVPETTAMQQVKGIQERIAHEGVKFCKTFHLFMNEFVKNNGIINDFKEMMDSVTFLFPLISET